MGTLSTVVSGIKVPNCMMKPESTSSSAATAMMIKRRNSFMSEAGVDVPEKFREILRCSSGLATAIAAIKTLMVVLEKCTAETLQELVELLKWSTMEMKSKVDCSVSSVVSGSELFLRFITLASRLEEGRILVHSKSRTVIATLVEAHVRMNKRFKVYVTEPSVGGGGGGGKGGSSGGQRANEVDMRRELEGHSIGCTVIADSAVGYILEGVDCVMLGAEGVVESGGIVNKMGTYTIALCAKELNKPVYVMCESFKFVRLYPLNQQDLPDEFKYHASTIQSNQDLSQVHPLVDYTPPSLLTLLFADLGILTPSAVSDELIKLYL